MRVVIFGSRTITDKDLVAAAIKESGFNITEVVEGGQRTYDKNKRIIGGVDWLAKRWAIKNGKEVQTIAALWELYGRSAGPRRNSVMAEYVASVLPDAGAIAVWDGESKGTRDMLTKVRQSNIPLYEKIVTCST